MHANMSELTPPVVEAEDQSMERLEGASAGSNLDLALLAPRKIERQLDRYATAFKSLNNSLNDTSGLREIISAYENNGWKK